MLWAETEARQVKGHRRVRQVYEAPPQNLFKTDRLLAVSEDGEDSLSCWSEQGIPDISEPEQVGSTLFCVCPTS